LKGFTTAAATNLLETSSLSIQQFSSCSLQLKLGNFEPIIFFPIPVDNRKTVVQRSKKQKFIRIRASPLREPLENPFPMFPEESAGSGMISWGIPSIPLQNCPRLRDQSQSITTTASSQFSAKERKLREKNQHTVMMNVKETLLSIYLSCNNLVPNSKTELQKWYYFNLTENNSVYAICYIEGIRIDPSMGTLVADGAFCALQPEHLLDMRSFLETTRKKNMLIRMNLEEYTKWCYLIPNTIERVRKKWDHTPDCEYLTYGIPRKTALETDVIDGIAKIPYCTCGIGKDLSSCTDIPNSVRKYFVRVALPLLYPSSFQVSFVSTAIANIVNKPPVVVKKCAHCSTTNGKLKRCSRCNSVYYCSTACQKSHWATHKLQCKPVKTKKRTTN